MRRLAAIGIVLALVGTIGIVRGDQGEDAIVWGADAAALPAAGVEVLADAGAFVLVHGSADALQRVALSHEVERVPTRITKGGVDFDARAGDGAIPAALRADSAETHALVQFRGPILPAWTAWLEERADLLDYVPHHAFLVRAKVPFAELAAHPLVRFVGAYHPAYKLHPAMPASGPAVVDARVFAGESVDAVTAAAQGLGAQELLRSTASGEGYVRFALDAAKADDLARHPSVAWLEPVFEGDPYDNDRAAWVTQSGRNPTSPEQPRGNSVHQKALLRRHQVVSVADGGVDNNGARFNHEMFDDPDYPNYQFGVPQPGHRKVAAYFRLVEDGQVRGDYAGNQHGTHTSGSTSGDAPDGSAYGSWNKFDGQAPASKLVVMDWSQLPLDYYNIFEPTYQMGTRSHSNSYGYPHDNSYTIRARQNDLYAWKHPDFQIFRSNGNTGGNTLRPEAVAKNVVGSGATNNGDAFNTLASFSSRGPTQDGRIKPTFTAPGNPVNSANIGTGYVQISGTSMSTPTSAGAAALVREYYLGGWYTGDGPGTAPPMNPSSALVRATMINSARPMTSFANWPDGNQGWGVLRLDEALPFPGDPEGIFVRDGDVLSTGQAAEYTVRVTDPSLPLKVTLAWTDPAAAEGANPALVSDLDLVVVSPLGVSFKGNVFLGKLAPLSEPSLPVQSFPGGAPDRRNVEEQALFLNPAVGDWTIRVVGTSAPFLPQAYAVVATGGV